VLLTKVLVNMAAHLWTKFFSDAWSMFDLLVVAVSLVSLV
jgi:hypothetical protein